MNVQLDIIEKDIINSLKIDILKNKNTPHVHNHQPVNYIVDDCMYCKLYGNVCCNPVTLHKLDSIDKYFKIPLFK